LGPKSQKGGRFNLGEYGTFRSKLPEGKGLVKAQKGTDSKGDCESSSVRKAPRMNPEEIKCFPKRKEKMARSKKPTKGLVPMNQAQSCVWVY